MPRPRYAQLQMATLFKEVEVAPEGMRLHARRGRNGEGSRQFEARDPRLPVGGVEPPVDRISHMSHRHPGARQHV
eukprot:scaffold107550_cov78-Phaeocystis_antarctica.AAC.1